MLSMYAEDAVFDVSEVFTDVDSVRGSENIRRYWETLRQTWDSLRLDPLQGFELDDGRFVVEQRMWAKGTRSGIGIDQRIAIVYRYRTDDNLVTHAKLFPDLASALAAAEPSASQPV